MAYKPIYILVLFAIICIDYTAALFIEKTDKPQMKKLLLGLSLFSNIGILAYFKYYNFIFNNLSFFISEFGVHRNFENLDLLLPIGLSFHTFQSMAYTIEVARGNQKAEKHLGYFSSYVLFFPQMVAGPIEKYATLGKQLREEISYKYENFSNGFRLILYGLFVKVVVADSISYIPDLVFSSPGNYSTYSTWIAVFVFSVQIYADFFGYSIIAVGVARFMGVHLMDNFKSPYFAATIVEFWNRWHISLTTWFREYVYFSIGGNKVSKFRWVINILLVFGLSGLWHGASWNFVWWGLSHGILYLIEKPIDDLKIAKRIIRVPMILLNFCLVSVIWVYFRSSTSEKTEQVFSNLIGFGKGEVLIAIEWKITAILGLFLLLELLFRNERIDKFLEHKKGIYRWSFYTALIFVIFLWSDINTKPFIYFQF